MFRWDQEAAAMRKRRGPSDSTMAFIRETVPRETLRSRRDYKRPETVDSADGDNEMLSTLVLTETTKCFPPF